MAKYIELEQRRNIAEVFLNRPEAYYAFNLEMITELDGHLVRLAMDNSVHGIVITGRGKAFCAGGDLKWAHDYSARAGSSFHTLASQLHLPCGRRLAIVKGEPR